MIWFRYQGTALSSCLILDSEWLQRNMVCPRSPTHRLVGRWVIRVVAKDPGCFYIEVSQTLFLGCELWRRVGKVKLLRSWSSKALEKRVLKTTGFAHAFQMKSVSSGKQTLLQINVGINISSSRRFEAFGMVKMRDSINSRDLSCVFPLFQGTIYILLT